MKTLGLIGGTSWHSTVEYYRIINQQVNERLGGANSAKMLLYSINFEELKPPADWSGWIEIANKLTVISNKLQVAGADCVIICSNTPHIVADLIHQNIKVPLLHTSIYTEFGKGIFKEETKRKFLDIIYDLKSRGAEGIIFGCTEIPLLIRQEECPLEILDTTLIHSIAAVDFALQGHPIYN